MKRLHGSVAMSSRCLAVASLGALLLLRAWPAHAATALTVTPITWDVVGLDSNDVSVGPNHFPIGVRACTTATSDPATNLTATFAWDAGSTNPYLDLRTGTQSVLTWPSLAGGGPVAAGSCTDFYYEVEVQRNPAAYDTTRRYTVTVTADGGVTATSPTPREIYVEHLISQSRNYDLDLTFGTDGINYTSVAPGASFTLMVGETYYIQLWGKTATNGYEQIETFLSFPNTIFQILDVSTDYTADTSAYVGDPDDKLYGDACKWDPNPYSLTYRSCLDVGKAGGDIVVTYQVKILSSSGASQPLGAMIYDFSGSSYHYNSDYSASIRFAYPLDPADVPIAKSFVPDTVSPGGTSTLTIQIANPSPSAISGVNFTDTFPTSPGNMVVANPTGASTSASCGSPTFSPSAGAGSISFSNGTIPGNSTCVIKVNVVAPTAGTYNNTTEHLFIDGTTDTGNTASASLTASTSSVAYTCGITMARWTVPVGATNPPDAAGGVPTTRAGNVSTATASAAKAASSTINTANGQNGDSRSWQTSGYKTAPAQYLQFVVQTKNYRGVVLDFYDMQSSPTNGPQSSTVSYSTDGTNYTSFSPPLTRPAGTWTLRSFDLTGLTSTTGNTWIRIIPAMDANNDSASVLHDYITFTGCSYIPPPTLSKAFATDPIAVGGTSALTFTVSNPGNASYDAVALTGVAFSDTLPTGLRVATPNGLSATCDDAPYSGTITATAGTQVISLSGASLAASASCTVTVNVEGVTAGSYENVSGYVDSAETDPNRTSTGYGTDTLKVVAPPTATKAFGDASILTGETTTLTITVSNPNTDTTLNGVGFTDNLPSGMVVATPNGLSATCDDAPYNGSITATAGDTSVALSGAILASGATCSLTVDVVGQTAGTKNNSTGPISSTEGGNGAAATATLVVRAPNPGIALSKQVGPSSTGPWNSFLNITAGQPVYYRLTIENTGDVPLDPVTVTDPTVSTSSCSWRTPLPVVDASDDDHIDFCVVGPVTAVAGYHPNTATASGTGGGLTATDEDTASYSTTGLTLVKLAQEADFLAGCPGACDTVSYEYGVTNTGAVDLDEPVTVSDDKVTVTCPDLADDVLNIGETTVCTATYTVTGTDETAGQVTNVATAAADGVSSNDDTQTVPKAGVIDLEVTKTNGSTTLVAGGTTTYTVTVKNNGPSTDGAYLYDPAVTGLTKLSIGTCYAFGGATCPTAGAGANELNITNLEDPDLADRVLVPSMPVGGSIAFTVTASVTGTPSTATTSLTNVFSVTPNTKQDFESANSSDSDTDGFAQNFGHLPTAYLNTKTEGGPYHLTGATHLGPSVPTEGDGTDATAYAAEASDNGVAWSASKPTWTVGVGGGAFDIAATCPAPPCTLYAWFDWNQDGDFDDAGEQILAAAGIANGAQTLVFDIPAGASLTGVFYARFRLYEDPPDTASPGGQAVTSGNQTIGEVEDYEFRMMGGVMTPVTLARFLAAPTGDVVRFEWSTATETGNVGFHLYVHESGRTTRLNEELIPSHAVDSLGRQDYVFEASTPGRTFTVEDVSVFGEVRRHGPFALGLEHGARTEEERVDWTAVRREMAVAAAGREQRHGLRQAASLGLQVTRTGIHRVGYEALRDAGLDLARVPLRRVTLTNLGRPVPFHAATTGPHLVPGGYLEFFGEAFDSLYTDANVYTLRADGGPQPAMAGDGSRPGALPAASYEETTRVERQRAYANYAPATDPWYDTAMLAYKEPRTWTFPFSVDGLADTSAPATLELVLWGVTNWPQEPDHHVRASLNGVDVADELFEGLVEHVVRVSVPGHVLREGDNALTITLPGDTGVDYDLVNLDRFSVTYPRELRARDHGLVFTSAEAAVRVTNLADADVTAYRLEEAGPVRLSPVVEALPDGTFAASFPGDPAGNARTYAVSAAKGLFVPEIRPGRGVADLDRPAQYLVISHPSFLEGLSPLVAAREAQGLTVSVVDVTDLYERYTFGVFDPLAIRRYLAHAVRDLGTEYVLLVGGDTYDYRNHLGTNSVSFIPSVYASTGPVSRFVPVDPSYADVDGDDVPDVAIGRFPVRTAAELQLMVDKTLAYEGKDYGRTAAFAADGADGPLSFKNISARLAGSLPPDWFVQQLNLDDLGLATARSSLLAAMNRGTALVTFTGHSGPLQWSTRKLFGMADAAALTNAGRPFVLVQWGCWNTYFVDPVNKYLVQGFLFSGDQGAAAVLGASTLTSAAAEAALGERLTPRLAVPGTTVGRAVAEAKRELAEASPGLVDVQLGWSLMGDPALVVEP